MDVHAANKCGKYCKVHSYWDFTWEQHVRYPLLKTYLSSQRGWINQDVFVGPPAYYPKKPTSDQWGDMQRHCPHWQMDLSCSHCLRHVLRPVLS